MSFIKQIVLASALLLMVAVVAPTHAQTSTQTQSQTLAELQAMVRELQARIAELISQQGNTQTGTSVTLPRVSQPTLVIGDRIRVTDTLNVRANAGTANSVAGRAQTNAEGVIVGGPRVVNGMTWWQVNFDSGLKGWGAGNWIESKQQTQTATSPTGLSPAEAARRCTSGNRTYGIGAELTSITQNGQTRDIVDAVFVCAANGQWEIKAKDRKPDEPKASSANSFEVKVDNRNAQAVTLSTMLGGRGVRHEVNFGDNTGWKNVIPCVAPSDRCLQAGLTTHRYAAPGTYTVSVRNTSGQEVYTKQINIAGTSTGTGLSPAEAARRCTSGNRTYGIGAELTSITQNGQTRDIVDAVFVCAANGQWEIKAKDRKPDEPKASSANSFEVKVDNRNAQAVTLSTMLGGRGVRHEVNFGDNTGWKNVIPCVAPSDRCLQAGLTTHRYAAPGTYTVSVRNTSGQEVYTKQLNIAGPTGLSPAEAALRAGTPRVQGVSVTSPEAFMQELIIALEAIKTQLSR